MHWPPAKLLTFKMNQPLSEDYRMNGLKRLKTFFQDEEGASVVEYGVLIALIVAACITVIVALGIKVEQAYNGFSQKYDAAVK